MTDLPKQLEKEWQEQQDYSPVLFQEAPSVVFTQIYGKNKEGLIVQFNLTVRANSIQEALDDIMAGIEYGGEKYKLSTSKPEMGKPSPEHQSKPGANNPPSPSNSSTQQPPNTSSKPSPSQQQAPSNQQHGNDSQYNTISAVKMEVIPRADGKVQIKWYEINHRYPDIYAVLSPEKAVEMLSSTGKWEISHMEKAGTFNVQHKILWQESQNLNSNGKPYKNIASISPM